MKKSLIALSILIIMSIALPALANDNTVNTLPPARSVCVCTVAAPWGNVDLNQPTPLLVVGNYIFDVQSDNGAGSMQFFKDARESGCQVYSNAMLKTSDVEPLVYRNLEINGDIMTVKAEGKTAIVQLQGNLFRLALYPAEPTEANNFTGWPTTVSN